MKRLMIVLAMIAITYTLHQQVMVFSVQPLGMGRRYEIWYSQSQSMDGGGYRDTTMWVILKTSRFKNLEEMFDEIKYEHDKINDESDCLTIYLYKTKEEFDRRLELGCRTYYKDKMDRGVHDPE